MSGRCSSQAPNSKPCAAQPPVDRRSTAPSCIRLPRASPSRCLRACERAGRTQNLSPIPGGARLSPLPPRPTQAPEGGAPTHALGLPDGWVPAMGHLSAGAVAGAAGLLSLGPAGFQSFQNAFGTSVAAARGAFGLEAGEHSPSMTAQTPRWSGGRGRGHSLCCAPVPHSRRLGAAV